MSVTLNKPRANKFIRVIAQNPQLLTCNSYLNFLRFYKTQHPHLGLRKILQNGFKVWINLNTNEKKKFKQKKGGAGSRPRLKWSAKSHLRKIPRQRLPKSYKRLCLNVQKNIEKRRRILKPLRKYQPRKRPVHHT